MPIRFFPCLLLIAVLPPIEASDCARSVVGILINFNPLLVILDTKADKSPTVPPPKAIIQSDLLKLFTNKVLIILLATSKLFIFSFADKLKTIRLYFFKDFLNFFNIFEGKFLSLIIHIFLH